MQKELSQPGAYLSDETIIVIARKCVVVVCANAAASFAACLLVHDIAMRAVNCDGPIASCFRP